jgi:Transposase IS116/IS110/IS902 family
VCRLPALLVELVPGGISKEITVNRAAALLEDLTPTDPVAATRHDLALEHLEDLRRLDEQMRASKRCLADAVRASRTTVTEVFGFGPVGAAIAIGHTRDVSRFADRDHFAAYNGTAPIEVGSGGHSVHRLSRRANRQLNHAIHIAAITQIRHAHSPGRAFYDRKLAEGKTKKEAIRALKRRISDALYQRLVADAATNAGPGGQAGTTEQASVTSLAPQKPALRNSHSRTHTERRGRRANTRATHGRRAPANRLEQRLDNKEVFARCSPMRSTHRHAALHGVTPKPSRRHQGREHTARVPASHRSRTATPPRSGTSR